MGVRTTTVSAQRTIAERYQDAAELRRQVIERLLKAHEGYFDIQRDYQFCGRVFPGYGEFHSVASSYVLVKRAKLWEASAHEYLFFLDTPWLDRAFLDDAVGFVTERGLEKVQLSANHMTFSYPSASSNTPCKAYTLCRSWRATPSAISPDSSKWRMESSSTMRAFESTASA